MKDSLIIPYIFEAYPQIKAVQSTRLGGLSFAPYDSMNLGSNTADSFNNVEQNKKIFTNLIGFTLEQVVRTKQIHGTSILVAEKAGYYEGYDAIVTNNKNLLLAISTADCTPILLYDSLNNAIAAIHAGWKGTKENLVSTTLMKMESLYGTKSSNIIAYIGPCIAECSFEVDADVAQYFDGLYSRFDSEKEKYFIDLKRHNKDQLTRLGVDEKNIEVSIFDTFERTDLFFSHRKEKGITGRMWSTIGMLNE